MLVKITGQELRRLTRKSKLKRPSIIRAMECRLERGPKVSLAVLYPSAIHGKRA